MAPFLVFDWQSALTEANFIPCKKKISLVASNQQLSGQKDVLCRGLRRVRPLILPGGVVRLMPSFRLARLGRATMLHDVVMENTDLIRFCSLRLNALARENHTIAALNARISSAPDQLVEELMVEHGWSADDALSAVHQAQKISLEDIAKQIG